MSRETTIKRNQSINDRYTELSNEKTKKGKDIRTHDSIVEQLADEFYLSEARVEDILRGRD